MSAGREWERYIWHCAYASAISFNCSAILLDIRVCVWVWVSGRPVATTKCHVSFLFQFAMCEREAAQQQIWFWTQSSLTLLANGYAILYRSVRLSRWVFVSVCVCLCVCSDYRDETTWPAFNSINVPNASLIVGTSASSPRPRPRPRWQHSARASSTTSFYCWLPQPLPLLSELINYATRNKMQSLQWSVSCPSSVASLPAGSSHCLRGANQFAKLHKSAKLQLPRPLCQNATKPTAAKVTFCTTCKHFFLLISKFG